MAENPSEQGTTGYGRPPQHSRFKPGRSGNPGGRPKTKPLSDELRKLGRKRLELLKPDPKDNAFTAAAKRWLAEAAASNDRLLIELANRLEGPPAAPEGDDAPTPTTIVVEIGPDADDRMPSPDGDEAAA